MLSTEEREEAQRAAWSSGQLDFTLTPLGRVIKQEWLASLSKGKVFVENVTRKGTKSSVALTIAASLCIQKPGYRAAFVAPVEKHVQAYVGDLAERVFSTCPLDLMPTFVGLDIEFNNGSRIMTVGLGKGTAAGTYNNLRSFTFDLAIVDEAGFVGSLETVVDSVLKPCVLPMDGHIVLLSTPPETADHPFKKYCDESRANGCYSEHTILESHYSREVIETFIKEMGGLESPRCQREYFCKFVVDQEWILIPEYRDVFVQAVQRDRFFPFYKKMTILDV